MKYKLGLKLKCRENFYWVTARFEKDKYYKIIQVINIDNFTYFIIQNKNARAGGEVFDNDLDKYFYNDKEIRKQKLEKINENR